MPVWPTMRFGSTAEVLAKRILKYCRISECGAGTETASSVHVGFRGLRKTQQANQVLGQPFAGLGCAASMSGTHLALDLGIQEAPAFHERQCHHRTTVLGTLCVLTPSLTECGTVFLVPCPSEHQEYDRYVYTCSRLVPTGSRVLLACACCLPSSHAFF